MIHRKTDREIRLMQEGGRILSDVLGGVLKRVKPGVRLESLNAFAEKAITSRGAKPSFHNVPGYRWALCTCLNEVVVHGIPDRTIIAPGDIVGIDCGVFYKGYHTDASWTTVVSGGNPTDLQEKKQFLFIGEQALIQAIKQVKVGNRIGDISQTIQHTIESAGFSVARTLVGHGIGKELHEDPEVPGIVTEDRMKTPRIEQGMALAIEVIYMKGDHRIRYRKNDKWTIQTKDGTISGLFEATVAVTSHGCIVLTKLYGASRSN